MALVIPEDHYECAFIHTQVGTTRLAVVTMGVSYAGNDFEADAPLMGGAWLTVMGELSNQIHWVRFTMRNQEGTVIDLSVNSPGGSSNACASYQNAYLVKKVTNVPGRRNQGRMYLPGVSEGGVDPAGVLSTITRDDLQGNMDQFYDEVRARDFHIVILHQEVSGGGPQPPPVNVASLNVDPRVATQRHRLRK